MFKYKVVFCTCKLETFLFLTLQYHFFNYIGFCMSESHVSILFNATVQIRHLWFKCYLYLSQMLGQVKLTAPLSTNANVLSAFCHSQPAGTTLKSYWGGQKVRCGKWKVEPLIYPDPQMSRKSRKIELKPKKGWKFWWPYGRRKKGSQVYSNFSSSPACHFVVSFRP
jgi:hypothetical protein